MDPPRQSLLESGTAMDRVPLPWPVTLLLLCGLSGCTVVDVGVRNPVPGLESVAVAPFFNLSQERTVDGREFALAYYSELQKVPGFEVLPVGVAERAMLEHGLKMDRPDDALQLARILGVDAVVIGAITDYDPYSPRVGLKVAWYSPRQWLFLPNAPGAKFASAKTSGPDEFGVLRAQAPETSAPRSATLPAAASPPAAATSPAIRPSGVPETAGRKPAPSGITEIVPVIDEGDWETLDPEPADPDPGVAGSTDSGSDDMPAGARFLPPRRVKPDREAQQAVSSQNTLPAAKDTVPRIAAGRAADRKPATPAASGPVPSDQTPGNLAPAQSGTTASEAGGTAQDAGVPANPVSARTAVPDPRPLPAATPQPPDFSTPAASRVAAVPPVPSTVPASPAPGEQQPPAPSLAPSSPPVPPIPASQSPTSQWTGQTRQKPASVRPPFRLTQLPRQETPAAPEVSPPGSPGVLPPGSPATPSHGLSGAVPHGAALAPGSGSHHATADGSTGQYRASGIQAIPRTPLFAPPQNASPDASAGTEPDSPALIEETIPELIFDDHVVLGREEFDPREPLMAYVRMFDSTDARLVARLADYLELSGETRSGDLEAYMKRSDFFRKFTAHVMISEMLMLHGGESRRRFLLKQRRYR